ncbi:MAG: hypothetical protein JWQ09_1236 [Segetibacter sp.]|nr:hypothetical protein [Segetibacter sp.]
MQVAVELYKLNIKLKLQIDLVYKGVTQRCLVFVQMLVTQ